jgi:hypothetical protein
MDGPPVPARSSARPSTRGPPAHPRHLLSTYLDYHRLRPHQGRGNLVLGADAPPPDVGLLGPGDVVCHEQLGGVLKTYQRRAA